MFCGYIISFNAILLYTSKEWNIFMLFYFKGRTFLTCRFFWDNRLKWFLIGTCRMIYTRFSITSLMFSSLKLFRCRVLTRAGVKILDDGIYSYWRYFLPEVITQTSLSFTDESPQLSDVSELIIWLVIQSWVNLITYRVTIIHKLLNIFRTKQLLPISENQLPNIF